MQAGKTRFTNARLYLSTVRLVLECAVGSEPLRAFDAPLVRLCAAACVCCTFERSRQAHVRGERFNQPIFGCNNLSGSVFQVRGGKL